MTSAESTVQTKKLSSASITDRLLLLATGLLAAWQIAEGINSMSTPAILAYTIGFGMLLVACLLLIILGFEALDSPIVALVSTVIPLSLSLGLVWQLLPEYRFSYLLYAVLGFLAIITSRSLHISDKLKVVVLSAVHGTAGIAIFALPFFLVFSGRVTPLFFLVSAGGALIGSGGLLLLFEKADAPLLSHKILIRILPGILMLSTIAFAIGLSAV